MLKAKSENARTAGGLLKEGVEMESGGAKGKTPQGRNDAGYITDCYSMEQH